VKTNPNAPSPDSWIANPKKASYPADLGHDEQKLIDRRADLIVILRKGAE